MPRSPDPPAGAPRALAVLFVDVTGSTRLYEELGDERAHEQIDRRLRLLERAAAEHGGRIVKELGDGLLCAFGDASDAVRAAHAMQLGAAEPGREAALGVHVGCHLGPVIESAGDLFGDSVNVAARIASLAKTGQVILTRELVDRLDPPLRRSVRGLGRAAVKGRREPVEILEYVGEGAEELTAIRPSAPAERAARLRLVSAGREQWFDGSGAGALTLGRDASSDVVVADKEASRRHARIEKRGERFVLVDHSANGTWVAVAGEPELCLRREELLLRRRGRIALGRSTADAAATILDFECH